MLFNLDNIRSSLTLYIDHGFRFHTCSTPTACFPTS